MDFVCEGCGKYSWIPPEDRSKREAIENIDTFLDLMERERWLIEWFNYHEPAMMHRLRNAVNDMLNRRD